MCSFCDSILGDVAKEHDILSCPLRKSFYCPTCAIYGHKMSDCPDKPSILYTKPAFLEQLIPQVHLDAYQITTSTPITYKAIPPPQQVLEIKDDGLVIGAYLSARSLGVPIADKKGIKKKRALEAYAKTHNMRVVYIS